MPPFGVLGAQSSAVKSASPVKPTPQQHVPSLKEALEAKVATKAVSAPQVAMARPTSPRTLVLPINKTAYATWAHASLATPSTSPSAHAPSTSSPLTSKPARTDSDLYANIFAVAHTVLRALRSHHSRLHQSSGNLGLDELLSFISAPVFISWLIRRVRCMSDWLAR